MSIKSWFLKRTLPDQIKRMIFLSSLAAYIRDLHKPDKETLERLNDLLLLSSNVEALRLPMEIQSKIWGSFDVQRLQCDGIQCQSLRNFELKGLAKSEVRIVANRLIEHMPTWMKYQSKEGIRQDIYRLFLGLDIVLGKPSQINKPQLQTT